MDNKPQSRIRYVYELNDLDVALAHVKLDIAHTIRKLRKCESPEFRAKINNKEAQQAHVSYYTNQFKLLLKSRDYIMEYINRRNLSVQSEL